MIFGFFALGYIAIFGMTWHAAQHKKVAQKGVLGMRIDLQIRTTVRIGAVHLYA